MAILDAFSGGVQGFWFDAVPISNFYDLASGGSALAAYSTRDTYGANGHFGRWIDLSGNNNHGLQTDSANRGSPLNQETWHFVGNLFDDLLIADVGGSTTGFYFAIACAMGSYYGTLFSDQNTASSNNGFRLYHNADGDGTHALICFTANGVANGVTEQGEPLQSTSLQVHADTGGSVYANASLFNVMVLQCWYDGSRLYLQKDAGAAVASTSTLTVNAGGTTAYLNSNVGTDFGSAGLDVFAAIMTKNSVPSAAIRDEILAYMTDKIQSGGARGLTANLLTTAQGTITAPAGSLAALSGQSMTFSQSSPAPARELILSGEAVTSAGGSVGTSRTVRFTGQAMNTAKGTVSPERGPALTGQSITAYTGDVNEPGETKVRLAGQAATVSAGSVNALHSRALAGQALTVSQGDLGQAQGVSLTGQEMAAGDGSVELIFSGWRRIPDDAPSADWTTIDTG